MGISRKAAMLCFLHLTLNVALGTLAGFGMADAVTGHSPLYYAGSGVIGGILAGAARCL
jgi:hypothetical protein